MFPASTKWSDTVSVSITGLARIWRHSFSVAELDPVLLMEVPVKRIELSRGKGMNRQNKSYEVSKDGRIIVYPSLRPIKQEGKLRRILKKIIHFKKGH